MGKGARAALQIAEKETLIAALIPKEKLPTKKEIRAWRWVYSEGEDLVGGRAQRAYTDARGDPPPVVVTIDEDEEEDPDEEELFGPGGDDDDGAPVGVDALRSGGPGSVRLASSVPGQRGAERVGRRAAGGG